MRFCSVACELTHLRKNWGKEKKKEHQRLTSSLPELYPQTRKQSLRAGYVYSSQGHRGQVSAPFLFF